MTARVLIVKPSSLGDIVHSLPVAAALAKRGAEVHFAARREYRPILEMCPAVSHIVDFPARFVEALDFLKDLRSKDYDSVIDLQGLLRSALATACARTPRRIGLPDSREGSIFFYDEIVSYPAGVRHSVDRYMSVLNGGAASAEFGIEIPPEAFGEAARLCVHPEYVVCSPLARRDEKMWRKVSWVRLSDMLVERDLRVVFVGRGGVDWESPIPSAVNLINKTSLPVLCAVLSRAKMCVTVDSAPMHLAAALGVPVLALFGPSDPSKVGPYSRRGMILQGKLPGMADLTCEGVAGIVVSELRRGGCSD